MTKEEGMREKLIGALNEVADEMADFASQTTGVQADALFYPYNSIVTAFRHLATTLARASNPLPIEKE